MTAEQWIAVATGVQAAAVVVALLFARRQLREMAASRREAAETARDQSRAYVVVYLGLEPELRSFPNLIVENLGSTAAYDITVTSRPPLRSSFDGKGGPDLYDVGWLNRPIPTLAPGQRLMTLFDSMIERPKEWNDDAYEVEVAYSDRYGEHHTDRFTIDVASQINSTFIDELGLRSVSKHLKALAKEFHEFRTNWGGPLQVEVEARKTRRARVDAEREAPAATPSEDGGLEGGVAPGQEDEVEVSVHLGDGGVVEPPADGLEGGTDDEQSDGVAGVEVVESEPREGVDALDQPEAVDPREGAVD